MATVLLVSACGGGGGGGDDGGSDSGDLAGQQMVFVGFGGEQQEAQTNAWIDPFAEETGVEITQESAFDNARLRAQVESGNVLWDVQQNLSFFVTAECGELFQPLENVDMSHVQEDFVTNECGVPISPLGVLLTYNSSAFTGEQPQTWADFFDLERFPGRRVIYNAPTYALEAALLGDGVAPEDLYPLDEERAFAKLDSIRDQLVFAESPADLTEQLLTGEASMAVGFSARGYTAAQTDPAIQASWDQAIFDWDYLAIPMGAPNADVAEEFLSFVAQPEQQAAFIEDFPYGITTNDTEVELDELAMEWWVNNPENQTSRVDLDQQYWAENNERLNEAWLEFTSS